MCDFEDRDIMARYPRKQAVDDGILVEIHRFNGKPVMATKHIYNEIGRAELLAIWKEFRYWVLVKPALPEAEQMFSTGANGRKVWVIEDSEAFTIMYPEDY